MNGSTENTGRRTHPNSRPARSGPRPGAPPDGCCRWCGRSSATCSPAPATLAELLPRTGPPRSRAPSASTWPERQRRYQVQDEIADAGATPRGHWRSWKRWASLLIDADDGRVGFPTIVNDQAGLSSRWQPGEDRLRFWHFAGRDASAGRSRPSWIASRARRRARRRNALSRVLTARPG